MVDPSTPLDRLDVLVLDCQSTGASPKHGYLLEIAWARATAASTTLDTVTDYVVSLPDGESVPRRIQRMTGIGDEELAASDPLEDIWRQLIDDSASVGPGEQAISVIHYARFEQAFLRDVHARHSEARAFPLDIICTHRIAQRLFPELPRRGIRALAGYLGHTVDEHKRAAHHVAATASIWHHSVRELDITYGVRTLGELMHWLETEEPKRRGGKAYLLPREKRLALSDTPGVYRMLSKGGDVLYVGKATSLKSRVNSYFQTRRGLSSKKLELVTQVHDLDVTECETPLEAALLESDEIKRHSPAYNTALRQHDRQLVFATRAWDSIRLEPDLQHRLGPLRAPDRLEVLAAIRAGQTSQLEDDYLRFLGETPEMLDAGVSLRTN